MNKHNENHPVVAIVDDDRLVGKAWPIFSTDRSADEAIHFGIRFLEWKSQGDACCLILDVRLPGLSGLDFRSELNKSNIQIPIVFMTGHGDIPMTVRAMKGGAIDFLSKPFRDQDMLDAVQTAIEYDKKRRQSLTSISKLKSAFESLTSREREIMGFVTAGLMNKQIANEIGVSEATVKFHRGT